MRLVIREFFDIHNLCEQSINGKFIWIDYIVIIFDNATTRSDGEELVTNWCERDKRSQEKPTH